MGVTKSFSQIPIFWIFVFSNNRPQINDPRPPSTKFRIAAISSIFEQIMDFCKNTSKIVNNSCDQIYVFGYI